MSFVLDNQLLLLILCFLVGCLVTAVLFSGRLSAKSWHWADLLWVVLGGFGALAAVLAGFYTEDSTRLERQIDIAFATTRAFDRDAARFRLAHCESDHADPALRDAVRALCDKVEFLSASTAENSSLPLFIDITRQAAPLQGLAFFSGRGSADERKRMAGEIERFDPAMFLVFEARDASTEAALARLGGPGGAAAIAGEFRVIAGTYDELITQVMHLRDEWQVLQDNAGILTLQVIALCLVALAAPFRLGKSLKELL